MSGGAKKSTPAQWVGGQRRKLVRRNRSNAGPPRSSTMPELTPAAAAASLVSSISAVGSTYVTDRQSEDSSDQHTVQDHSQTLDGKMQKQGLFHSKKPKPLEPQNAPTQHQQLTSPLPASTPTKAARFFGLEVNHTTASESPRRVRFDDAAIANDLSGEAPVRPALRKQSSSPLLTRLKLGAGKQTRFKEDVEPDEPKQSKATKGLRMLIPEFAGSRRSPVERTTPVTTRFALDDDEDDEEDVNNSVGGLQEPRFRIPAAPRPVPAEPRPRRTRRKIPKDLQRMSPITEASYESLRPANRDSEEVTELGVISEYEQDDDEHSAEQPQNFQLRSYQDGPYELEDADLSPSDKLYGEGANDEKHDCLVHPGTKVNMNQAHEQRGYGYHLRSPLQDIEDAYLDATEEEMRLEARRMTLARIEAEKQAMDVEIADLRRKHEQMKLDFGATVASATKDKKVESDEDENEDDDLISLCSSIDLDEEPTVHEAKVMTFTRITPGMVKLVDIPPRKKKPVSQVNSSTTLVGNPSSLELKKIPATAVSTENISPPLVNRRHHQDPDCTEKPKKSKLTRDESRLLVQAWVSDYNRTEQRPISTRIDPDVLADQETPPAPFPKSDESLPTPPIGPRSDTRKLSKLPRKHYCLENGHIFHPVDLKTMPDDTAVNSLEVRPYLQTYTGLKQHVKIPILCEKCAEDCDENVWECEIAVCRIVVCQTCAENMEAEWQQRAVNGWKYN